MESVFEYLIKNHLQFLSAEDVVPLLTIAKERTLPAGFHYIEKNELATKMAFIIKGIFRSYYVRNNGEEVTAEFRWENQFTTSFESFLLGQPSTQVLQALEETHILELDFEQMEQVLNNHHKLEKARSHLTRMVLADSMKRIESFVLYGPEDRYKFLLDSKPELAHRVPNKYIASYLGITPVSLSRIRKRMARKPH